MIRCYLLLSLMLISFPSWAASTLIDYQFGTDFLFTQLKIMNDGTVTRTEGSCCPAQVAEVPMEKIHSVELSILKQLLAIAATAELKIGNESKGPKDSPTGVLQGYLANGDRIE